MAIHAASSYSPPKLMLDTNDIACSFPLVFIVLRYQIETFEAQIICL